MVRGSACPRAVGGRVPERSPVLKAGNSGCLAEQHPGCHVRGWKVIKVKGDPRLPLAGTRRPHCTLRLLFGAPECNVGVAHRRSPAFRVSWLSSAVPLKGQYLIPHGSVPGPRLPPPIETLQLHRAAFCTGSLESACTVLSCVSQAMRTPGVGRAPPEGLRFLASVQREALPPNFSLPPWTTARSPVKLRGRVFCPSGVSHCPPSIYHPGRACEPSEMESLTFCFITW